METYGRQSFMPAAYAQLPRAGVLAVLPGTLPSRLALYLS